MTHPMTHKIKKNNDETTTWQNNPGYESSRGYKDTQHQIIFSTQNTPTNKQTYKPTTYKQTHKPTSTKLHHKPKEDPNKQTHLKETLSHTKRTSEHQHTPKGEIFGKNKI